MNYADIIVENMIDIKQFIIMDMYSFNEKLKFLTIALFRYATLYTGLKFAFDMSWSNFSNGIFTSKQNLFIFLIPLILISACIAMSDFTNNFKLRILLKFPFIYRHLKMEHNKWIKIEMFDIMLITFIEIIIFYALM